MLTISELRKIIREEMEIVQQEGMFDFLKRKKKKSPRPASLDSEEEAPRRTSLGSKEADEFESRWRPQRVAAAAADLRRQRLEYEAKQQALRHSEEKRREEEASLDAKRSQDERRDREAKARRKRRPDRVDKDAWMKNSPQRFARKDGGSPWDE